MCNAKPGRRCAGPDTQRPIVANAKKLQELKKAYDNETNPDKRAQLRDLVIEQNNKFKESKVTYYASAKAQKDQAAAIKKVKELTGDQRATYDDVEETLFIAGGHLHEFQATADQMRKSGASQIEVARYFNQGGILFEKEKIQERIRHEPETELPEDGSFDARTRKQKALEMATGIMWRDCAKVVGEDMKKNSRVYTSSDGNKLAFRKRPTGRFAVTSEYNVKASSATEAALKGQNAFNASDVTISVKPVAEKPDEYRIEAEYIYKGGENLTDAILYQNQIYRGELADF